MKVAYKHLLECISSSPDIEDLSNKLFQLGHEHEINEEIFDIELTPNRGDCLSLNGLARDLRLFYDLNLSNELYEKEIPALEIDFTNNQENACTDISFLKIDIESDTLQYTGMLEAYFSDLKVKKNNFFTDISNFISYETGQPTHCYDASAIDGEIVLDYLNKDTVFETLLDKSITLTGKNLVFLNNNEAINLAGIIGNKSTSCKNNTSSVIIECAYFNPEEIIGKSIKYDIQSDAAHKFERGVDPANHDYVLRRFLKVVEKHATIKNVEMCNLTYKNPIVKTIPLEIEKINSIIGSSIDDTVLIDYLKRLNFKIYDKNIEVPSYRHDIHNQNDIAEEIARAVGYDNIQTKKILIPRVNNEKLNSVEPQIKNLLIDNGFFEVINNPFVSEMTSQSVCIDNPLDSNRGYLRTNLKQSLLNNLIYNERRQKDSVKLFEISNIYKNNNFMNSPKSIGIIASGRVGRNYLDFSRKINNEYLSEILKPYVNIQNLYYEEISRHEVESKTKTHITYLEIELNKINSNIIDYKNIKNSPNKIIKYEQISEYPISTRDLSFSVEDFSQLKSLEDDLLNFNHDLIKDIFIFDYFHNQKKNEIKVAFRFVFQSNEKTITDQEVSIVMDAIIKKALNFESISIPGLQ